MSVSAFPAVVDALVALAPSAIGAVADGVTVSDGLPPEGDPADFLAVGVPSLDEAGGSLFSGESRQSWAEVGNRARNEEGVVHCLAAARATDETVKDARDRAFAIVEAIASLCRSNPTLGVASLLWTSYGVETNASVLYESGRPPAYVVEFHVAYKARI